MVVAAADLDLFGAGVDPRADFHRFPEVHRRAFDRASSPVGISVSPTGVKPIGVDRHLVVEDVAGALAREVEVGVLVRLTGVALSVVAWYSIVELVRIRQARR